MHKIIYTGLEEPRDKQTYLWKRKDENGNMALYEYDGASWVKMQNGSEINSVSVSVDDTTGTPEASASIASGELSIAFSGLKGETGDKGDKGDQGNTGSSVDYPYELVNNRTTDDATKGLTAAEGKRLGDDITQLAQQVNRIDHQLNPISVTASSSYTTALYAKSGDVVKVNVTSISGRFNMFTEGYTSDIYLHLTDAGYYIANILNDGYIRFYMHTAGTLVAELSLENDLLDTLKTSVSNLKTSVSNLEEDFEYVAGKNLYDKSLGANNGYIDLYGNISDNSSGDYTYSHIIQIEPNTYYYLSRNIAGNANIRCLDADGNPVKVLIASTGGTRSDWSLPNETGTSGTASGQFKTPSNAVSVQFNIRWGGIGDVNSVMLSKIGTSYIQSYNAPDYEPYELSYKLKSSALPSDIQGDILSLLKGKSVCIFGGSVARLCSSFGGSAVMEAMSGVVVTSKAQDGGGYAKDTTIVDGTPVFADNCICKKVNEATTSGQPTYDIYLLWSSTNDLYVTPGDPADYTFQDNYDVNKITTQCGGMNYCIKKLQEFSPSSRIIVIGSLKAVGFTYVSDFLRLQTLVEKQKGVAALQSLPCISLWDISGANYYNRDTYFQWTTEIEGSNQNDGTHPNVWAYRNVIGPKLIKGIALLY